MFKPISTREFSSAFAMPSEHLFKFSVVAHPIIKKIAREDKVNDEMRWRLMRSFAL